MLRDGRLSAGHAKAIAGIEGDKNIIAAAEIIVEKGLSVREAEKLAKSFGKEKKPATEKPASKRIAYFDEVELALSSALGRKARVITKGKKESGTLEIAFNSKEDLGAIAKALSALED